MIQVEYRPTNRDEKFVALVHVYLELRLSFQAAHAAAAADWLTLTAFQRSRKLLDET
jgi:hypothetical protein